MLHDFNSKLGVTSRVISTLALFLCAGLYSMNTTEAYSHPYKSNSDPTTERGVNMKDKHEQMRKKAQEQRSNAQERATGMRKKAAERRELQKQKSIKRRAESEKEQAKHLSFKTQLLSMLMDDEIITSEEETVNINYLEGDPIANGINLSKRFGDKYKSLWFEHNRVISKQSYLNIMPGSYEIREITKDGTSRHFVTQTN